MEQVSRPQPILYMTLGLPGAGKTFFARQYAAQFGFPLVDIDQLRFQLFEIPEYSRDEDNVVLAIADYMIEQFLSAGLSVVVDGLNHTRIRRHGLRELARKNKAMPFVVWIQVDEVTAFNRATKRDRRNQYDKFAQELTDEEFDAMITKIKAPQHEEYAVISGKHVFKNQMNVVVRKAGQLKKSLNSKEVKKSVSLGGRVDENRRHNRPRLIR